MGLRALFQKLKSSTSNRGFPNCEMRVFQGLRTIFWGSPARFCKNPKMSPGGHCRATREGVGWGRFFWKIFEAGLGTCTTIGAAHPSAYTAANGSLMLHDIIFAAAHSKFFRRQVQLQPFRYGPTRVSPASRTRPAEIPPTSCPCPADVPPAYRLHPAHVPMLPAPMCLAHVPPMPRPHPAPVPSPETLRGHTTDT